MIITFYRNFIPLQCSTCSTCIEASVHSVHGKILVGENWLMW